MIDFQNMTEMNPVPDGPHAHTSISTLLTAENWLVPFKGIHMRFKKPFFCFFTTEHSDLLYVEYL